MDVREALSCTAFAGSERIAHGDPRTVALACKALIDAGDARTVLAFDDVTAEPLEMDLRGAVWMRCPDVWWRACRGTTRRLPAMTPQRAPRALGRPRLGVVGREVTLLPRHWEWLNAQPGGASVALRKMVDQARRANEAKDRVRRSQEVAFRFTSATVGNEPGYEEATRALFAGNRLRFEECSESWPLDVRDHARTLAADAWL